MPKTFVHTKVSAKGKDFDLLIANEYPWLNLQIITFDSSEHDEAICRLKSQPSIGWVVEYPGRRDFAVIHIGGSGKLYFTQDNHKEIIADMKQCLIDGAECWAKQNYMEES